MIIEANVENIEEIVKISWELLCDSKKSSFPKFKNYSEMYSEFLKSHKNTDDKLLVYYEDGEIIGTLNLMVKKNNRYLQGGIFAKKDFNLVATQIIDYLKEKYSGYEMYLGYPLENKEAINFFEGINAELMDSSLSMELKKDNFKRVSNCEKVIILEIDYYNEYAEFHDKHNANIYWTSERIFENIDSWSIYIIVEGCRIIGSIFIKSNSNKAEVFGIAIDKEYKNKGLELKLLSESIYNILLKDKKEILFFVDEDAKEELKAAIKIGFKQIDTYRCYKYRL